MDGRRLSADRPPSHIPPTIPASTLLTHCQTGIPFKYRLEQQQTRPVSSFCQLSYDSYSSKVYIRPSANTRVRTLNYFGKIWNMARLASVQLLYWFSVFKVRCLLQPYIHTFALDAHIYILKSSEYCLNTSAHSERTISWILNKFWAFQLNAYLSVYYVSLLNNWSSSMQSPFVRMNSCASLCLPKGKYTFHGYCHTAQQPRVKY